ncbi:MAG: hypothetical protein R2844_03330 [Caldilineales bacterium]
MTTANTFETPPSASINRVQIIELPGLPLDEEARGLRGNELISSRALMSLAAPHADALGLDAADQQPGRPNLMLGKARAPRCPAGRRRLAGW